MEIFYVEALFLIHDEYSVDYRVIAQSFAGKGDISAVDPKQISW